jgi:hypothetical protein
MNSSNSLMCLMVNSINSGASLGGFIMQCFQRSLNGTHFEAVDGTTRITDFGEIFTQGNSCMVCLIPKNKSLSHGRAIGNTIKWFPLALLKASDQVCLSKGSHVWLMSRALAMT